MRKLVIAFLLVSFAEIIGAESSLAAELSITWRAGQWRAAFAIQDPQLVGVNVFSHGKTVGPNKPPAIGGNIVIIDVVDRTSNQLGHLQDGIVDGVFGDPRYVLVFNWNNPTSKWIYQNLYYHGFVTTKWSDIRGSIWDRKSKRMLSGDWRYAESDFQSLANCKLNCDYEACLEEGLNWFLIRDYCDCEEYVGRWFCHKKDYFTYSEVPDRE